VKAISMLKIKLFADGADKAQILQAQANPLIQGFTTNPTLMRAAGVKDYETFAHEVLAVVTDKPISFEVFADDFPEMKQQGAQNHRMGEPCLEPSLDFIRRLLYSVLKVNVTAILTLEQVPGAAESLGLLWASPRELLNISQANDVGCHIITAPTAC